MLKRRVFELVIVCACNIFNEDYVEQLEDLLDKDYSVLAGELISIARTDETIYSLFQKLQPLYFRGLTLARIGIANKGSTIVSDYYEEFLKEKYNGQQSDDFT